MQTPSQASSSPGRQSDRLAQAGDGRLEHPGGETAPAGVGGGDAPPAGRGEQHRQAVGDLHRAGDARLGRDAGIGIVHRRLRQGIAGADPDDAGPMHLAQEHRRGAADGGEAGPIGGDPLRRVADGDAEVHRGERAAALPALARRHQRADAPARPGRREPARRPAHAASGQAEAWVVLNAASAMQFS